MAYILNGASPLSYIMLFPPHGTRERVVFDNFNTRSHTHLIISIPSIHVVFPFSGHNAHAHLAWGVTRPVRQTARNRLKIGVRREGTVSDDILETRRLPLTDGSDPASICLGARRGGYIWNPIVFDFLLKVHHYFLLKVRPRGLNKRKRLARECGEKVLQQELIEDPHD